MDVGDVRRPAAERGPSRAWPSSTALHPDLQPRRRPREAKIGFNVGQGTQDLGFRSDVDILFTCEPAVPVDARRPRRGRPPDDGLVPVPRRAGAGLPVARAAGSRPTSSSIPRSTARPARRVLLPPGTYTVEYTRGPEYLTQKRTITVPRGGDAPRVVHAQALGAPGAARTGSRATTTSTPPAAPTTRARPRGSGPRT